MPPLEFYEREVLPGDPRRIIHDLPDTPLIKGTDLYLALHRFFELPAFSTPYYSVESKKNCPPCFIKMKDGQLQNIGEERWHQTYLSQPAVKLLLWKCADRTIALVSQPTKQIQNEADVAALYSYLESWAVGLLSYLKFPVTGAREVRREQEIELQPKAPEDNDLGLRLDATISSSIGRFRNFAWYGIEFKAYGMNSDENWAWPSPEALNLQSQLKK